MFNLAEKMMREAFPGCPKGYDLVAVYVPDSWFAIMKDLTPALFLGAPVSYLHNAKGVAFEFAVSPAANIGMKRKTILPGDVAFEAAPAVAVSELQASMRALAQSFEDLSVALRKEAAKYA